MKPKKISGKRGLAPSPGRCQTRQGTPLARCLSPFSAAHFASLFQQIAVGQAFLLAIEMVAPKGRQECPAPLND